MDNEVQEIKAKCAEALFVGHAVIIERTDYGFRVHQWTPNGVAPQSDYDTPHEAIARAAQLLKVRDQIVPQSWPESVEIGSATKG